MVQVRAKSYASRQQLAVSPQARSQGMELEWDRRFISVLGVANKRLYQLRLQTADQSYVSNKVGPPSMEILLSRPPTQAALPQCRLRSNPVKISVSDHLTGEWSHLCIGGMRKGGGVRVAIHVWLLLVLKASHSAAVKT